MKNIFFSDVSAISTPFGKGALSVVRLSGAGAKEIVSRVFVPKGAGIADRRATYGEVCDPKTKEPIDDGILTFYEGPRSYTGEDSAEFCGHGGIVVTGNVLKAFLDAGARMARPGEFSRRAFLAGKLSLLRAEGIVDLIDAKTDAAARLARKAANGALEEKIDSVAQTLTELCAALGVLIDYPDQTLSDLDGDKLAINLAKCEEILKKLLASFSGARAVTEGVKTYLVGRPNVGKSSLFNALLGEERAIVTEIPGTTRDLLEYPLCAGKLLLRLTDTAGLRESADKVEQIGVDRVKEALNQSSGAIVLALFDLSEEACNEDRELVAFLETLREKHIVIPILTKTDLNERFDRALVAPLGEAFEVSLVGEPDFSPLFDRLERAYIEDENALLRGEVLMNLRQYDCVKRARGAITEAKKHLTEAENDICVTLLEEAIGALKEIDGREVSSAIADEIFKRFCVGK